MKPRATILFRRIQSPRPAAWHPGLHWYVELHDASGIGVPYPLGVAYVSAHRNMVQTLGCSACLDYIQVADHRRREGVATRLVAACRRRWPDIWLTDAISDDGAALLASLGVKPRAAGGDS